jgi:glycosyltransferase involved in cell wall biosynthesis
MVATSSLERELATWGFRRMARWSRGVDMKLFHPGNASERQPLALYVGRVAYEKNIEAFLQVKLPHGFRARVVGDGPALAELKLRHPQVEFTGALSGEALAAEYRRASVFVFPSRTDTFGLVLLESLASGVPVAAYPVAGPRDVLEGAPEGVGFLDEDLGTAISLAVARGNSQACCDFVSRYTWEKSTKQFLENLVPRLGSGEPEKNCPTHRNDRKSWRPRQASLLLAR